MMRAGTIVTEWCRERRWRRIDLGKRGKAYNFDGKSSYITSNIGEHSQLSFSAWFYISEYVTPYPAVLKYGDFYSGFVFGMDGNHHSYISNNTIGNPYLVHDPPGGDQERTNIQNNLGYNKWYHAVGLVGNNSGLKLYLNGQLAGVNSYLPDLNEISGILYFGRSSEDFPYPTESFYKGLIDDVRIYNRVLSEAEVAALYELEKPETTLTTGLVAYYPFNGNANDESGNGNDGILGGNSKIIEEENKSGYLYAIGNGSEKSSSGGHLIIPDLSSSIPGGFFN